MENSELSTENGSQSPPGIESTKHAELKVLNNHQDNSSVSVEGSISRMGILTLSVKDYMSSLHNYIETFSTARSNGTIKPAPSVPTSISDMLKLCEADPVDLLIDLGFGIDEPDICTKIPSRFIMTPSEAKGINTRVFLEAQKMRMETEHPNLCGRFRQLEVLEQVTSAFSSLLNDIHTNQNNGTQYASSERKSTLTPEKRKRIRQLLWKVSKQLKIVDENSSPTINHLEADVVKEEQQHLGPLMDSSNLKDFRKQSGTGESSLVALSCEDINKNTVSDGKELEACSPSTPMKQRNHSDMAGRIQTAKGSKMLLKTFKKTAQQRLLSPDPESFEMEEVLSFEEDCPRTRNQDKGSEMTRTNSCQSDSSGFQEDPSEPLPLQKLHESSESNDSQTTLREKADFSVSYEETQEYANVTHVTESSEICANVTLRKKEKLKSLSINSEDVFQSFDINDKENIQKTESQEPAPRGISNEEDTVSNSCLLQRDLDGSVNEARAQSPEVPTEFDYPFYVTHFISDISGSIPESPNNIHPSPMPDFTEECVSDLQKNDSDRDSFADDECSVELYSLKWTPSPTSDLQSSGCHVHTLEESIDYSDGEQNSSDQDKKSTFQTELSTNIYKSVTIQMPSNWSQDPNDGPNRVNSVYSKNTNRSEVHALLQHNTERKEAFSQTDVGWWNECHTNNHNLHQRSCYLTESHSFDTVLWPPYHSPRSPLSTHCCHCCHCYHCCIQQSPTSYRHDASMRTSPHVNLERELTDTLKLLRESLITISLNKDEEVENMKRACQKYREKLIETEQRLTEQQAGCYNLFTREERENMRRLHLLRQNVLREAIELEFNLDARAHQVKETIAAQLEEVLEEQSRLYSELEFYNLEKDKNPGKSCESLQRTQSLPSTPCSSAQNEDHCSPITSTPITKGESRSQSQKIDLSTILEHIKKTFRSFNNS
ncbi:protein ITPRID1 isoform X1 [Engystomops pustulosus]|uniref:protein ITPRID1 isoform X1 n=2 Tax=Engystomops pustulosus TaxID=76066 RepID=UPI003AFA08E7